MTLPRWGRFGSIPMALMAAAIAVHVFAQQSDPPPRVARPTFEGNQVRFDWNSGGDLQLAPTPQGPWTTVSAPSVRTSTTSLPALEQGAQFFRVMERGIPGEAQPIIEGDPRRPVRIRTAFLRKASSARGNALMEVTLQPGQTPPRQFPLLNNGDVLQFRDDGTAGDTTADDGVFTAPVMIDLDDFTGANQFFQSLPPEFQVQGAFTGRGLAAEHGLTGFDSGAFDRGERVQVFPSPFEGFGSGANAGVGPEALRKTLSRQAGLPKTVQRLSLTNIDCRPFVTTTNVFVRFGDPTLVTNVDCFPVVTSTNLLLHPGNPRTETVVECFTNLVQTNVVVGVRPAEFRNEVFCRTVVLDPGVSGILTNICTTNLVPRIRPGFATNVVVTEMSTGIPWTNVVVCTDVPNGSGSIVKDPTAPGFIPPVTMCFTNTLFTNGITLQTNLHLVPIEVVELVPEVHCQSILLPGSGPITTNICTTNAVLVSPEQPIFETRTFPLVLCRTNTLVIDDFPVFTNVFVTNFVCRTNILSVGDPRPIFEELLITNLVCFTNITFTNITTGGGIVITNSNGDPVVFTNGVPPGQGGLNERPAFWNKSLMITDLSVVEDPARTFDPCTGVGTRMGAWTFGKLMADICNQPVTGIHPGDFARRWVRSWQKNQEINFETVHHREPEILAQVINDWEAASGGPDRPLDLSIAPFRLLAIVNRVDLRGNPGYGVVNGDDPCNPSNVGGEGRFVFCLIPNAFSGGRGGSQPPSGYGGGGGGGNTNNVCDASQFTVIFEYGVPKRTCQEIKEYGTEWYNLSRMSFGPAFNSALQHITEQFTAAGADPSRKPNQSALSQLRANELLREPWEMREWRIFSNDSDAGWLRQVTAKQTPAIAHNRQAIVAEYVLANAAEVQRETHVVPLQWRSPGRSMVPFLGGSAPMATEQFFWDGPAPAGSSLPGDLRHKFSLNTCNGCHAGETGTPFTHVFPRVPGQEARLSDFLTGANMPKIDPADGRTQRWFSDLKRREDDLLRLITEPCFFQLFRDPAQFIH